jgi:DhnA family fructose-bisphosphate aldolase class Ia
MGAPLLKVPVPDVTAGAERQAAVRRIVESVGVPVLFLGGPHGDRDRMLSEVDDAVAGGGAGMAIGRSVYQEPDPAETAKLVADIVHR